MGVHAFATLPRHCAAYLTVRDPPLPELFGFGAGWNMPVVRHEAILGPDANFPGVDHYVVTCHLGGARARRIDQPRFTAVADRGAISLQAPGSGCSIRSEGAKAVRYAHYYFQPSLIDEVLAAFGQQTRPIDDFFGRTDLGCDQEMIHYLARAAASDQPPTALEMDSRAFLIALALVRCALASTSAAALPGAAPLDARRLAAAIAFMEDRLATPPNLAEIAASVGLSPFHFARSFKASIGETPAGYLLRRRAERATDIIAQTKLPLAEVAAKMGYSSQSHMTRSVRKVLGRTPAGFRTIDFDR